MSKLKIKYFGPIKKGYESNDGFFFIKKVTVFIGNQGSGKSTIAKVFSTISWIEKSLMKNLLSPKKVDYRFFVNQCEYQNIDEYFTNRTFIEYVSDFMHFTLFEGKLTVTIQQLDRYSIPKIMYVPADRSLLSSVRVLGELKGVPSTLFTFADEFEKALSTLNNPLRLPIGDTLLEYQRLNKLTTISGADYKIKLSNASSGYQSLVPLFVVTLYLNDLVNKRESDINKHTINENRRLEKEIMDIISNPNLTEDVRKLALEGLSSRRYYSSLRNIVEEPELNLYPSSQRIILNNLLEFNNTFPKNQLVMTTHSPYMINYLTLAVKAEQVYKGLSEVDRLILNDIVPISSKIDGKDLAVYECDELLGAITDLETYKGMPSDENRLNEELGEFNDLFSQLLDLERTK
jgi:energy-coupling factor transporter ATP-binding protein EcfA2